MDEPPQGVSCANSVKLEGTSLKKAIAKQEWGFPATVHDGPFRPGWAWARRSSSSSASRRDGEVHLVAVGGHPPVAPRSTGVADGHAGADVLDTPLALRDLKPEDAASRMLARCRRTSCIRTSAPTCACSRCGSTSRRARRALAEVATHLKSAADQFDELTPTAPPVSRGARMPAWASRPRATSVSASIPPSGPATRVPLPACGERNLGDPDPLGWESGYREADRRAPRRRVA